MSGRQLVDSLAQASLDAAQAAQEAQYLAQRSTSNHLQAPAAPMQSFLPGMPLSPCRQLEHIDELLSTAPLFQADKHSESNELSELLATLILAIQRERGSTAGWIAGSGRFFSQDVRQFRVDTDSVLIEFDLTSIHSIHQALQVLREWAGESVKASPCAERVYTSLSAYTSLIQAVLAVQERVYAESGRQHVAYIAHLKETSAFQRGVLSGVLSLPSSALSSLPERCSADFTILLHRQRSLVACLEKVLPVYWLRTFAHSLRLDGTELDLFKETSVTPFDEQTASKEACVQNQWDIHTRHVDSLHAGELELSELHLPVSHSCSLHPNRPLPAEEMNYLSTKEDPEAHAFGMGAYSLATAPLIAQSPAHIPTFLLPRGEVCLCQPVREPSLLIDLTILRGHAREQVGQLLPAMFDERNPRGLPAILREIEACISRQDDARAQTFTHKLFARSQADQLHRSLNTETFSTEALPHDPTLGILPLLPSPLPPPPPPPHYIKSYPIQPDVTPPTSPHPIQPISQPENPSPAHASPRRLAQPRQTPTPA